MTGHPVTPVASGYIPHKTHYRSATTMLLRCLIYLCLAVGLFASRIHAQTEPRLALLIGNAAYRSSPLANPVNDVRLMHTALTEAGFSVTKAENASIRDMRRLIRDFGDRLKAAGGVGLFYFAGHGVQVRGENYLVSTDSDIRNEDEIADDSVNASVILEKMQGAGNRMNIIILDACRNNPFAVKSRSAQSGLATINAPSGTLVAYSTAPGSVASDGAGQNGLYTEHLAKVIRQPGLPVEEVFKQVRAAVRKESNNQQTPWENTALEGQFFFRATVPSAAAPSPAYTLEAARAPAFDPLALDLAFWDSVKNSQNRSELQAYLTQYPNGAFAALARARLEQSGTTPPGPSKPVSLAAVSPAAMPAKLLPPAGVGVLGTLVMTDTLTGIKRSLDVAVQESDAERTIYTTGDVIAKDGRVLQVRVGEAVVQLVSGTLWTTPAIAGTSGEARINRVDVNYKAPGKISWKAVATGDGKVRIETDVSYLFVGGGTNWADRDAMGKWVAVYNGTFPLPESFSNLIRSPNTSMASNRISAELKLR